MVRMGLVHHRDRKQNDGCQEAARNGELVFNEQRTSSQDDDKVLRWNGWW